jgi:hypothetical protein
MNAHTQGLQTTPNFVLALTRQSYPISWQFATDAQAARAARSTGLLAF